MVLIKLKKKLKKKIEKKWENLNFYGKSIYTIVPKNRGDENPTPKNPVIVYIDFLQKLRLKNIFHSINRYY